MAEDKKCKESDSEQLAGVVMASMGDKLKSLNSLDDLWNKLTLAELHMLTSLSEDQIRAQLPEFADKLLSLARRTQSADLSPGKIGPVTNVGLCLHICCWEVCCWQIA